MAVTASDDEPPSAQELKRPNLPLKEMRLPQGRHFDQEIIVYCKLSSRDLVQMMAERDITLTHTIILRWVQRYVRVCRSAPSLYCWYLESKPNSYDYRTQLPLIQKLQHYRVIHSDRRN